MQRMEQTTVDTTYASEPIPVQSNYFLISPVRVEPCNRLRMTRLVELVSIPSHFSGTLQGVPASMVVLCREFEHPARGDGDENKR